MADSSTHQTINGLWILNVKAEILKGSDDIGSGGHFRKLKKKVAL